MVISLEDMVFGGRERGSVESDILAVLYVPCGQAQCIQDEVTTK